MVVLCRPDPPHTSPAVDESLPLLGQQPLGCLPCEGLPDLSPILHGSLADNRATLTAHSSGSARGKAEGTNGGHLGLQQSGTWTHALTHAYTHTPTLCPVEVAPNADSFPRGIPDRYWDSRVELSPQGPALTKLWKPSGPGEQDPVHELPVP